MIPLGDAATVIEFVGGSCALACGLAIVRDRRLRRRRTRWLGLVTATRLTLPAWWDGDGAPHCPHCGSPRIVIHGTQTGEGKGTRMRLRIRCDGCGGADSAALRLVADGGMARG